MSSYPMITDRKPILIPDGSRTYYAGIRCTVWLSAVRHCVVSIDNILLGLTDENEADVFIKVAQQQLGHAPSGYGRAVPA